MQLSSIAQPATGWQYHPWFSRLLLTSSVWLALFVPLGFTPCFEFAAVAQAATESERKSETDELLQQGFQQLYTSQLQAALNSFQQATEQYQQVGDRVGEATALLGQAETYLWLGQYAEELKLAQQALGIYQSLGDRSGEATALHLIGDAQLGLDQTDSGLESLRKALAIRREVADRQGEGWTLGLLGIGQIRKAELVDGLETLQQSLNILQEAVEPSEQLQQQYRRGVILAWIGNGYRQQKEYEKASQYLQEAMTLSQTIENRSVEMLSQFILGVLLFNQEKMDEAVQAYQRAQALAVETGNQSSQADAITEIGAVYLEQSNYAKAVAYYQQALKLYQVNNNRQQEGEILNRIGVAYDRQENYPDALDYYQRALAIHREVRSVTAELQTLDNIARLYSKQENYSESIEYYQQMLVIYQEKSDRYNEAETLYKIGGAYRNLEQFSQALESYQQALEIYRVLDKPSDEAPTLYWVGATYREQEQYQEALEAYGAALTLYMEIKDTQSEANTLNALGYTYLFQSQAVYEEQDYLQSYQLAGQGLTLFQEQLDVARTISNRFQEGRALTSIGQAYGQQSTSVYQNGDYEQALELDLKSLDFHEQALAINRELKDDEEIQSGLNNIFNAYHSISMTYDQLEKYELALESIRNAQMIALEAKDPEKEYIALWQELSIYSSLNLAHGDPIQYEKRLKINQQIIILARRLNQPKQELRALSNIAQIHRFQGRYAEATEVLEQALSRARATENSYYEMIILQELGMISVAQADYSKAIVLFEQARQIGKSQNRIFELVIINQITDVYQRQGNYSKALEYTQKVLSVSKNIYAEYSSDLTLESLKKSCLELAVVLDEVIDIPDTELFRRLEEGGELIFDECQRSKQMPTGHMLEIFMSLRSDMADIGRGQTATALDLIGMIYANQGNYSKALEFHQQALAIERELENFTNESIILNNIAKAYSKQGNYAEALNYTQQALEISISQKDHSGQITFLLNLGDIQRAYGNYAEASNAYQKALTLTRQSNARSKEAAILLSMGQAYSDQGNYAQALQNVNQALNIQQEIGESANVASTLNALGVIHSKLGQYQQAFDFHQQAFDLTRKIGAGSQETTILLNLAATYRKQGKVGLAMQTYQQTLTTAQNRGEIEIESIVLTGISKLYLDQSQAASALPHLQQALVMQRQIKVRLFEADTLQAIGQAHTQLNQLTEAQRSLQQSLILAREIGDRATEAQALANLGNVSTQQNQPEIAIAFYKQSVNLTELIRQSLRVLPSDQQKSYTETVAKTYRHLADLLLQKNRVLEAQRVLDLLKVQELEDYLRNVRGTAQTASGVENWQPEARILELYQQVLLDGTELAQLRQRDYSQLTADEQQRLSELTVREGELLESFGEFIEYPEVVEAVNQLRQTTQGQNVELADFRLLQTNLEKLQQNAVLLYPLILDNRLELVLVTSTADAPIRYPVPVPASQLNATILQLRQALQDPSLDAKTPAHQLYEWLIKPLESYLSAANAKTILYAPDGALRYIPLATLHDGDNWLSQRFGVTHITAASLTNFDTAPQAQMRVLAAACAECSFRFQVGEQQYNFQDLPYTEAEVKTLASDISGTATLINQAFTPADIRQRLGSYNIIHLATHAAFVQGQPSESFIVFGNGERITLPDVSGWNLSNVDLVVLSACETAVTEQQLGNGIEVLGFGYQMQVAGAKAALASLWKVNDGGTQILMNAFYTALLNGNTKAEAMQKAQIALITGDFMALGGSRGNATISVLSSETGLPVSSERLDHPYYWAPFILIGNGL